MQHLEKRSNIESSKAFQRLSEKTQVFFPLSGREQVVKNRMSHSYEVATSAQMIGESISQSIKGEVDYQKSLYNVSLLHDIGHPPFGHAGAGLIDSKIRQQGLSEGFDDNNNNLVVIEKNGISVDDYDLASLIKYPEKLYGSQEGYKRILKKSIQQDIDYFSQFFHVKGTPERTVACNIMDEADRNSYVTSDLADFFTLSDNFDCFETFFNELSSRRFSNFIVQLNEQIFSAYQKQDKNQIKAVFNRIKNAFNQNFILNNDLTLGVKSTELYDYRELLGTLSKNLFIKSDFFTETRAQDLSTLEYFIDYVFKNNYYPSKSYSAVIASTNDLETQLRAIRDMIGEVSDWYIINMNKVFDFEN